MYQTQAFHAEQDEPEFEPFVCLPIDRHDMWRHLQPNNTHAHTLPTIALSYKHAATSTHNHVHMVGYIYKLNVTHEWVFNRWVGEGVATAMDELKILAQLKSHANFIRPKKIHFEQVWSTIDWAMGQPTSQSLLVPVCLNDRVTEIYQRHDIVCFWPTCDKATKAATTTTWSDIQFWEHKFFFGKESLSLFFVPGSWLLLLFSSFCMDFL